MQQETHESSNLTDHNDALEFRDDKRPNLMKIPKQFDVALVDQFIDERSRHFIDKWEDAEVVKMNIRKFSDYYSKYSGSYRKQNREMYDFVLGIISYFDKEKYHHDDDDGNKKGTDTFVWSEEKDDDDDEEDEEKREDNDYQQLLEFLRSEARRLVSIFDESGRKNIDKTFHIIVTEHFDKIQSISDPRELMEVLMKDRKTLCEYSAYLYGDWVAPLINNNIVYQNDIKNFKNHMSQLFQKNILQEELNKKNEKEQEKLVELITDTKLSLEYMKVKKYELTGSVNELEKDIRVLRDEIEEKNRIIEEQKELQGRSLFEKILGVGEHRKRESENLPSIDNGSFDDETTNASPFSRNKRIVKKKAFSAFGMIERLFFETLVWVLAKRLMRNGLFLYLFGIHVFVYILVFTEMIVINNCQQQ